MANPAARPAIRAITSAKAKGQVTDTQKELGALHVHSVRVTEGSFAPGDAVDLKVDHERRRATRANHSATHLLHAALKRVLGSHVSQKGSLVNAERLRFDFSHPKPVTAEELEKIEAQVNAVVRQNSDTTTRLMATDQAIAAGAEALFGEKYGDEVRVLSMGTTSTPTRPIRSNCAAAPMSIAWAISGFSLSWPKARWRPACAASRR